MWEYVQLYVTLKQDLVAQQNHSLNKFGPKMMDRIPVPTETECCETPQRCILYGWQSAHIKYSLNLDDLA